MPDPLPAIVPGSLAEWVGSIATALAFGATAVAIWTASTSRRRQYADALFDEALKVSISVGQSARYEPGPEQKSVPQVAVTVTNGGRRPISDLALSSETTGGEPIGQGSAEFLQAGLSIVSEFDAIDGAWGRVGFTPTITAKVDLRFTDISGTRWRLTFPDARLVVLSRPPSWRIRPVDPQR